MTLLEAFMRYGATLVMLLSIVFVTIYLLSWAEEMAANRNRRYQRRRLRNELFWTISTATVVFTASIAVFSASF